MMHLSIVLILHGKSTAVKEIGVEKPTMEAQVNLARVGLIINWMNMNMRIIPKISLLFSLNTKILFFFFVAFSVNVVFL